MVTHEPNLQQTVAVAPAPRNNNRRTMGIIGAIALVGAGVFALAYNHCNAEKGKSQRDCASKLEKALQDPAKKQFLDKAGVNPDSAINESYGHEFMQKCTNNDLAGAQKTLDDHFNELSKYCHGPSCSPCKPSVYDPMSPKKPYGKGGKTPVDAGTSVPPMAPKDAGMEPEPMAPKPETSKVTNTVNRPLMRPSKVASCYKKGEEERYCKQPAVTVYINGIKQNPEGMAPEGMTAVVENTPRQRVYNVVTERPGPE